MKDLLVHLNVSKHCQARLGVAARLARTFDARLTGVYTSALSDVAFFLTDEIGAGMAPSMKAWWLQMRDKAKLEFDTFRASAGIAAGWVELDGNVDALLAEQARYADLTIVGQIDPDELLPRPEYGIPEGLALESGRPVLLVPHAWAAGPVGRRILVAWNGSAQAARAVNDAIPLLRNAERTLILTLDRRASDAGHKDMRADNIAAHLARHGIRAETLNLTADDHAAGETILAQAKAFGADMVVMGAYGHTRAREIILGGATRSIFRQTTLPIFMSH